MPPKTNQQKRSEKRERAKLERSLTDGGSSAAVASDAEAPVDADGPGAAPSSSAGPMAVDGHAPDESSGEVPDNLVEIPFPEDPDDRPSKVAKTASPAAAADQYDIHTPTTTSPPVATDPVLSSMMAVLLRLEEKMTIQTQTSDRIIHRFESTDKRLATMEHRITDAVGGLDSRFAQLKNEVETKLAGLSLNAPPSTPASSSSTAAQPKPAWVQQGTSIYSQRPAASPSTTAAAPAAAALPTTPAAAPRAKQEAHAAASEFGRKVIVVGFPHTLPRPALLAWWEEHKVIVPAHFHDKGTFQGGHGKVFSVVFPTRADARLFTSAVATSQHTFQWLSPREGAGHFTINFKTEKTIQERERGRALSGAWRILSPLILKSNKYIEGYKFTTDPRRGVIAVSMGNDMRELVHLKNTAGVFSIITDDANLLYFGISHEIAETIKATIVAAATAA
jgi:hypothetical protein